MLEAVLDTRVAQKDQVSQLTETVVAATATVRADLAWGSAGAGRPPCSDVALMHAPLALLTLTKP